MSIHKIHMEALRMLTEAFFIQSSHNIITNYLTITVSGHSSVEARTHTYQLEILGLK